MNEHLQTRVVIRNVNDADAAGKKNHILVDQLSRSACEPGWGSAHQRTSSVGQCRHLLDIKCASVQVDVCFLSVIISGQIWVKLLKYSFTKVLSAFPPLACLSENC